jgi:TPR repeat protein
MKMKIKYVLLGATLLFPLEGNAQEAPVNEKDLSVAEKLIEENKAQKALDILLPLAKLNNAEAQNLLGELYHFGGEGVPVDYQKAREWYLKAVKGGNGVAANHLGRLYLNGEGVQKDEKEAEAWYKKGMELGDEAAKHNYEMTIEHLQK